MAQHSEDRVATAGRLVLHSVVADVTGDTTSNGGGPGGQGRWIGPAARLTFTNPLDKARRLQVRASFASPEGTALRFTGPGIARSVVVNRGATEQVTFSIVVPGGSESSIAISATGATIPNLGTSIEPKVRLSALVFDEAAVRAVVSPE